jgi:bifunctional ADP-heptose synthase (sugar kinase/adenylyltransferase)
VTRVRCQPGAAGTILNNLSALGIGRIFAAGFCGDDGEGWELRRALLARAGVSLDFFVTTLERHTFTYSKPLRIHPGAAPEELSRLDIKNWTPTPASVAQELASSVRRLAPQVDALILMDQVDLAETGVVTKTLLKVVSDIAELHPSLTILADSRRGLNGFPPVGFKMNDVELGRFLNRPVAHNPAELERQAADLAVRNGKPVFVTLAARGIVGAGGDGRSAHVPALPVRGEIDVVGAGDSVTANLAAALAAGAGVREAMELAMTAASLVVHQLGTTGTASVPQIRQLLPR